VYDNNHITLVVLFEPPRSLCAAGTSLVSVMLPSMMCIWAQVWQLATHQAVSDGPIVL
jgi:hypothetical protein